MKTPEEIKKGLKCHSVQWHDDGCPTKLGCEHCPLDNDYHDPDELMADALELIQELEKKVPQWISVEERLPLCGERVLITEGNAVFEAYLSISHKWVRSGIGWAEDVTRWMPLPEPPEEEGCR